MNRFKALVARAKDKGYQVAAEEMTEADLMPGDVLVRVEYASVNYKDALALTGKGKIFRAFPMVAGVDMAGEIVTSESTRWQPGDRVILTGWGFGETHHGSYAGYARVKSEWLNRVPEGMSTRQAMIHGTAGLTAALCVDALEKAGLTPERGEVLVTGSTGGVGSVAIILLARAGYRVVALTGKTGEGAYLKDLGAAELMDRALLAEPGRPLQHERWAGAVDTLGSHTLANACAQGKYGALIAATGLAQGMDLHMTVAPFILRGVHLIGVDSVYRPLADRDAAWARLARDVGADYLEKIANPIGFDDIMPAAERLHAGQVRGRYVVDMSGAR